jgi:hypothetical protein
MLTRGYKEVQENKASLKDQYEAMDPLFKNFPTVFSRDIHTFEEFKWAVSIIW